MKPRLEPLVAATRRRLEERRRAVPLERLRELAAQRGGAGRFAAALRAPGVALIAEYKRRSPSAGEIRPGAAVGDVVGCYERGGAAAISVLTERDHFEGSLEDLDEARDATPLPILRKDFTVDSYQLYEARAHGADAILLVVGALSPETLAELRAEARAVGLDAIVEVHDEPELDAALAAGAEVIGVNNRNLSDFTVDLSRTAALFELIPRDRTVISESGIFTGRHVAELGALGVDAVLVGEALMRAPDAAAAATELAAAGRAVAAPPR